MLERTWTAERLELLMRGFQAGMSCREIAAELGVSRNAVIGKLSRLNLAREGDLSERRPPKRARRSRDLNGTARQQQQMLRTLYGEEQATVDDEPISDGHRCSLLELSAARCRWPISTPGSADFCFCGNIPLEGLPYCAGHTRLAYRPTSRQSMTRR